MVKRGLNMVDVTVKQLAQVVGIPVERLLNQLQEAGLSFDDAMQIVNEDQKRTLLNYLKTGTQMQDKGRPLEKITLKRKSVTQVTIGHDSHSGKTVNVEVRKKRTYVKRSTLSEQQEESKPINNIPESPNIDVNVEIIVPADLLKTDLSENSETSLPPVIEQPVVSPLPGIDSLTPELSVSPESQEKTKADLVKQSKTRDTETDERVDKTGKRRHQKEETSEPIGEYKKHKQKTKLHLIDLNEEDSGFQSRSKRGKSKKRRTDEKADKYIEAEEALKHAFALPVAPAVHEVIIPETITISELANRMSIKAAEVIKVMMGLGAIVTINQVIDQDTAVIVVEELGHTPIVRKENAVEQRLDDALNKGVVVKTRAPVVTIMGHVDHGKTSLLDYIRRTKVASGEAGGITQHIGAYHVNTPKGDITFLDTPGHAAFTAMRARGAQATDIVVLIVAADDGVKPQTIEAIQHAKAAKVPIIVAINKIDKHDADPDRVINELSAYTVIPEAWGGDTLFVNISAKNGTGVDALLDAILLQAEVLELTAMVDGAVRGVVIESRLDKGHGPVATILVQSGTLCKGDIVLAGFQYGRVRALISDSGKTIDSAGPSTPVEVIGLSAVPHAGDEVVVVTDEKKAREVALFRQGKYRDIKLARKQKTSMEGLLENMTTIGDIKTLNIVLKADVQGSIAAISDALIKLSTSETKVEIISSGVGGITESDVNLAVASHAILIGFNVRADGGAKKLSEQESVSINYYSVIYDIVEQVKNALFNLLTPQFKEEIVGIAEVRDVFRSPKLGAIAGCMVTEGLIKRNNPIRVLRNNIVIYEGTLESLRRFKDDVIEVRQGLECGIGVKNYNDVKVGDLIEVFETVEYKRTL